MTGQEHIVVEVDGDFTPAHPGAIVEKDFELAVKFYEQSKPSVDKRKA